MKLHELKPSSGSRKNRKRVGRGSASGTGKTAGRGQKGQGSRSGTKTKFGFEGGQNPIQRRLPKLRGFKNIWRKESLGINISRLEIFDSETKITPELLREKGIIKKDNLIIKILGDGELTKPLFIQAHSFSRSAIEKIEKVGGKVETI
ncbi:MAG: 50S ribosomal protein L15 [Actinobacteria bacterium]|nr:50S ribosomal protein L15 [Actinomycetota bacterium]